MLRALVLILAGPPWQTPPVEVRQHVQRGYTLSQNGDLKGAEAELRQAITLAPNDPVALAVLGTILSQPPRLEEADIWLERALKLDPGETNTRYNLAFNLFRLDKLDAARTNLERILKQKPDHKEAKSLLAAIGVKTRYDAAFAQYRAGHFSASQALLEQMTREAIRDANVFRLLAWCHHRQNRPDEALAAMRQAIEIAPGDATSYTGAAQLLLAERNFRAASGAVDKALELAPGDAQAWKVKGMVETERGDLKAGLEAFARATKLDPTDPEAWQRLGTAQRLLFRYPEAAATFQQGIASFPGYARLYAAFAELLTDPGSHPDAASEARAVELLRKAVALDASLAAAHYQLGTVLLEEGKAGDALPYLERAASLEPGNSAAHLAVANAYRDLGRVGEQAKALVRYREIERSKSK